MNPVQGISLLLWLAILFITPAWAQRDAELTGIAQDATGSVIVGAQVTVANKESGVKTSTMTNEAGIYRILALQPGPYQIQASLPGFKTYVTDVQLEVGRTTTVGITMEIGEVSERVVVESRAPVLETDSQAVSNLIEGAYLKDMPLLVRRPAQLLNIAAAVTFNSNDPRSYFNPFYSVAGGQASTQQYYIDGGNASNTRVEISILDINPSIETVQEFRLVENNYKAEFGGAGGGLMLISTKAGTNEFHGSAWEFHRQKALDARNFFATEKTPFRENIFGAAVGGPIIKNKLHFFGSWEATHNVASYPQFETFPTPDETRGDFSKLFNRDGTLRVIYDPLSTSVGPDGRVTRSAFPNNIIPLNRISPIAAKLVSFYPTPNRLPVDPTGALNFFGTRNEYLDRNAFTGRVDWSKSERNKIFHRFLLDFPYFENDGPWPGLQTSNKAIRGAKKVLSQRHPADTDDFISPTMSKNFLTSWTHTAGAVVAETRFTYATRRWGAHDSSSGLGFPKDLGLTVPQVSPTTAYAGDPNDAFPRINLERYQPLGGTWAAGAYQLPMRNFHFGETVSMLKNQHSFKFGYETRRSSSTYYYKNQSSGAYSFSSLGTAANPQDAASGDPLASLLVDFPLSGSLNDLNNRTFRTWWHGVFIQDDWKVAKNFTVNLGLRYEVDSPMREKDNLIAGFDPKAINPVCQCPGTVTFPQSFNDWNLNNWMPRVGMVWAPKKGKTILRAGFGRFFNPPYGASIWGIPGTARPDVARTLSVTSPDNNVTAPYFLRTGLPARPPFDPSQLTPSFGAVPPGTSPILAPDFIESIRKQGYNMMLNANIQRELPNNILLEVGWLANLGHHLDRGTLRLNQVPTARMGPGNAQVLRPFPQFNQVNMFTATIGNSTYHALLVKAEKRFGSGLSFTANYTFSKFLDDFNVSDFYNRQLDKGPSGLQRRHRMVLSGVYELPVGAHRRYLNKGVASYILGGWNLGTLFTVQSGGPLNFSVSPNLCNCFNDTSIRPNLVGDPHGPKSITRWFNEAAFEHPGSFKFGNAGPGLIEGPGRSPRCCFL